MRGDCWQNLLLKKIKTLIKLTLSETYESYLPHLVIRSHPLPVLHTSIGTSRSGANTGRHDEGRIYWFTQYVSGWITNLTLRRGNLKEYACDRCPSKENQDIQVWMRKHHQNSHKIMLITSSVLYAAACITEDISNRGSLNQNVLFKAILAGVF